MDFKKTYFIKKFRNIICKSNSFIMGTLDSILQTLHITSKNYQFMVDKILDGEIYIFKGFTNNIISIIFL